jgi:outer membrane lipoprotein-sorting protein
MAFVRVVPLLTSVLSAALATACAAQMGDGEAAAQASQEAAMALLERLEVADNDLDALEADIQYIRRFLLQGDEHVRHGRLYYAQEDAQENDDFVRERRFGVHFDVLYLDERKEDDQQTYIFDGEWLIEKHPNRKQYIARQIAPPGSKTDPLKLGEGPVPFPLGQKAQEVLARFDVRLLPSSEGLENEPALAPFVSGCEQLLLIPKNEGMEDDDFQSVRIWYDLDTLLPRMALTINRTGDESIVQLLNIKRVEEEDLPADALTIDPPSRGEGWDIQIEEFRG